MHYDSNDLLKMMYKIFTFRFFVSVVVLNVTFFISETLTSKYLKLHAPFIYYLSNHLKTKT